MNQVTKLMEALQPGQTLEVSKQGRDYAYTVKREVGAQAFNTEHERAKEAWCDATNNKRGD